MRLIWLLSLFTLAGCGNTDKPATTMTLATMTLATTTSTRDSGLLDALIPMFQQKTGIIVKVVAVGTGQALEMGRRGDADVLLTHAPDAEMEFVSAGQGIERQLVMYNDFILVGPQSNPAKITAADSIAAAFAQLAQTESMFVSRGDRSGTNMKEMKIWQGAQTTPQGDWYIQAGSGMTQTLRMASEKGAYTLSDRGTFLSQQASLDLVIVSAGDPLLHNLYAVIGVAPEKHPHVKIDAARQFATFLLSPEIQATIADFGREKYGQPLFFPQAPTP